MAKDPDIVALLPDLRRYALTLTRDRADADDLLNSALLRAHERSGTYQRSRSLRRWLFAILHNVFISDRRRQQAEQRRNDAFADIMLQSAPATQEMTAMLAQTLARFDTLPDSQRAVMHLIAVEGMSYNEAADALGVPVGTVMSRLSRARQVLRGEAAPERAAGKLRVVGGERHD